MNCHWLWASQFTLRLGSGQGAGLLHCLHMLTKLHWFLLLVCLDSAACAGCTHPHSSTLDISQYSRIASAKSSWFALWGSHARSICLITFWSMIPSFSLRSRLLNAVVFGSDPAWRRAWSRIPTVIDSRQMVWPHSWRLPVGVLTYNGVSPTGGSWPKSPRRTSNKPPVDYLVDQWLDQPAAVVQSWTSHDNDIRNILESQLQALQWTAL